jgi:O-antigen/teichoic acid export membrane protein
MLLDTARPDGAPAARRLSPARLVQLARMAAHRLGWGVADQAMSSVSNFAVNIYIARTLGAVHYGAFALAYVTYGFALNASRGLATDPLLVRYSNSDLSAWKRAVATCTGTAVVVGLATGTCVLVAAALLHDTARMSFLALGLTLPGLLLQDSWRFSFFALGRGRRAFVNDTVWTVTLIPALVLLQRTGHSNVFWFVLAWGGTATLAAVLGPFQAGVIPTLSGVWRWVSRNADLGPRYLAEGTANSASGQFRNYGLGIILGLAAVGYTQAANTLMGPIMVIFFGMGLVTLPEAARILRRSPRRLPLFCVLVSAVLTLLALVWGIVLLVALPRGLGHAILGQLWRPTYPLVLPSVISTMGICALGGASIGLHALGAARRSLRAMLIWSALYVVLSLAGAIVGARLGTIDGHPGGLIGTIDGTAVSSWIGTLLFWWELRAALRDFRSAPARARTPAAASSG